MDETLGPEVVWLNCEHAEIGALAAEFRRRAPRIFASVAVLRVRRARLPFYKDHELFDLLLDGVPGVDRVLLLRSQSLTQWLDGQSAPIHAVNELESLRLAEATVLDYVRFFLFAMRGDQGAFVLIEEPGAISSGLEGGETQERAKPAQLVDARAKWTPLRLDGSTDDGRFRVRATIAYAGGLYASEFAVKQDGEIEMLDDRPLGSLEGLVVPTYPDLTREPAEPETAVPAARLIAEQADAARKGERVEAGGIDDARARSDLPVTESFVAVLLAEAVRGALGHRLLQRFNTQSHPAGSLGQLSRFVAEFAPVVVIESDIPFVEDIVVGLLDPGGDVFPKTAVQHAAALAGDDSRCWIDTRAAGAKLHMVSFHAYRQLWDADWTAHQLAIGDAAVLIGCERRADVPEPLRRVTDLFLKLPRIDDNLFAGIFSRIMGVPPPPRWRVGGSDWVRYLLHTDFHAPLRLSLDPAEAIAYLRERSKSRLALVSAVDSPVLKDLHGLGEARQVAEDLVADVSAARAGRISWQAVDRGLLLVGAPGTGKTTLARAIARACDIKFVHASATQWQSAGGLDQHLRAMRMTFAEARRYAPAILFIDEIDSIGNRETFEGSNAIYQTEVVNGLLEQIQGMDEQAPLIVIGATNFIDKIDPALRRAGRLDQVINVPRPNVAGLEQIFAYYLAPQRKSRNLDRDVKVKALAQLAFGLTGADVEFFVRGAARRARKAGRRICHADLVAEVTRRPRSPDAVARLSPEDMRRVAVHETGHALSALCSATGTPDLTFVTIIPRMDGSLGFTASAPPDGAVLTRTQVLERLRTILAGRAAEEVVYGKDDLSLSSGGSTSSDLAVATRTATGVVCTAGFGADGSLHWTMQPTAAQSRQIDALLRSAYRSAVLLLRKHRAALDRIVDALVESQELDGEAVRALWKKSSGAPRR